MVASTAELERPMLRMGSVAFLAGLAIAVVSTFVFHPSGTGEELMNNPFIFAVYAEDDLWIATHIGQFAGLLLIYAGGFVALFRMLSRSDSGTVASALAWFGLVTSILTASALTILQAVDGIALKIAVDTWYAIPSSPSEAGNGGREGEKAIALRVAEGLRWTEWGIQAYYRMLQGAIALIFGVAIAKGAILSRWIGAVGIAAGVAGIAAGVVTAYVGFSSVRDPVADLSTLLLYPWIIILGIFMWRKTRAKKMITS
ncbi:MAG TPA: hypothetical protein VKA09_11135 [Nitrososphaeraceae archaeon]|jgi:hypothetical protein|nr:hypothetical protein [Nitrososphaeraceae archaeon]